MLNEEPNQAGRYSLRLFLLALTSWNRDIPVRNSRSPPITAPQWLAYNPKALTATPSALNAIAKRWIANGGSKPPSSFRPRPVNARYDNSSKK